jgi:hypothetical protein
MKKYRRRCQKEPSLGDGNIKKKIGDVALGTFLVDDLGHEPLLWQLLLFINLCKKLG